MTLGWLGWVDSSPILFIAYERMLNLGIAKKRSKWFMGRWRWERLVCKEAKRMVKEEAEWIMWREWHQQEKLDLFLSELITVEEFERDSEAEAEAERSEVMGEGVVEEAIGTQTSEMEVDNTGEDEVVAEEKRLRGGRKQALSSPPKPSRKWTCTSTAIASKTAVVEKAQRITSTATTCDWCHHHNTKCVPTDGGARCTNCKAKHYRCSLVPAKEGSEGKATLYKDNRWQPD